MYSGGLRQKLFSDLFIFRFGARSEPDKLETKLYSPFAAILQNDVQGMTFLAFSMDSVSD